jgi:hypothetical protein
MNFSQKSLQELLEIRENFILEDLNIDYISNLITQKEIEYVKSILEDGPGGAAAAASIGIGGNGVAYSNATIAGPGNVVNAQPSSYAGATTGDAYTKGGGFDGSGDGSINVPYNPGGRKKVFQKIPAPLDDRKGSSKRRKNKILQGLKDIFANRQDYTAGQGGSKPSKIMNFDNFSKEDINKVTKVKQ